MKRGPVLTSSLVQLDDTNGPLIFTRTLWMKRPCTRCSAAPVVDCRGGEQFRERVAEHRRHDALQLLVE